MIKIKIPGEIPSKKNSRINTRSGRSFPSKQYQQWHSIAALYCAKIKPILNKQLEISINFIHGTLRRRDSDNAVSSILDLLVDTKIIQDDNWKIVKRIIVNNEYQKNNPYCEIQIKEIEE